MTCDDCKQEIVRPVGDGGTGYGDVDGKIVCYACCGKLDAEYMRTHDKISLYLNTATQTVSNWPGTLRFASGPIRVGRHNIAGKRYDCWFVAVGANWHGVQYGDNTQIVRCRKVK